MARSAAPKPVDQKHWKDVFEGSLTQLNGGSTPASKQPIVRLRQNSGLDSSKDAISAAAASLSALWQISPGRLRHSE
jgi:hypothetical protein